MTNTNKFIKNCSFCNLEFAKTESIKMKKAAFLKNKELKTTINIGIIRCKKCQKCFSCKYCENKLAKHYKCCSDIINEVFIFSSEEYSIEFDFLLLPAVLGGHIANVYEINFCKDYICYKFRETEYILFKLFENNSCCWIKDTETIKLLNKHKLNISIGENICINVLNSIQFNNKDVGYYNFKKIRPEWLRCSYSNRPLELDLYNEELKIAVEYNGQQHYKYTPFFHQNEEEFKKQLQRDDEKLKKCFELNINLIIIPYNLNNYKSIEQYIKSKI